MSLYPFGYAKRYSLTMHVSSVAVRFLFCSDVPHFVEYLVFNSLQIQCKTFSLTKINTTNSGAV